MPAPGTTRATEPAHFHHVHLNVTDPAESSRFYQRVFGAVPVKFRGSADALFTVNAAGSADVPVRADLRGVRELLVTEEPAGGSQVPTSPPVIVAPAS